MKLRWSFFILILSLLHFFAATSILKMVGVFQPAGLFLAGAAWVWFLMPRINVWMVHNILGFRELYRWAQK